jgi:hypothetical protein
MNRLDPMTLHDDRELQSAPRVFAQVGVLLSRPEISGGWFSGSPERAELFKKAFSCVVRLQSHTGWSEELVLEHLGCETKDEEISALTEERLKSCIVYMRWVETLLVPLDVALDKRLTVQGAARFFLAAGRDPERAEAAMGEGGFSAIEFLRIGEVAKAWDAAFSMIEGLEADRVRRLQAENPFVSETTPHLSPSRLEMLQGERASQLLGPRVVAHMREHLDYCQLCAASRRRSETLFADEYLIRTAR